MSETEPSNLKRGKAFHKKVQSDWTKTIRDGKLTLEQVIPLCKHKGPFVIHRKGRLDLFVDELGRLVSVIEIKSTNWNRVKPKNVGKLLSWHRTQLWKNVSTYLESEPTDVCPGLIYPFAPRDEGLKKRIEEYLNGYGIQVVWYEER